MKELTMFFTLAYGWVEPRRPEPLTGLIIIIVIVVVFGVLAMYERRNKNGDSQTNSGGEE